MFLVILTFIKSPARFVDNSKMVNIFEFYPGLENSIQLHNEKTGRTSLSKFLFRFFN